MSRNLSSYSSACDKCRRLHRKCDLVQPRCGLCERTGQDCTRSSRGLRFKQGLLGSGNARQSSTSPKANPTSAQQALANVRYIDETDSIVRTHHTGGTSPAWASPSTPQDSAEFSSVSPRDLSSTTSGPCASGSSNAAATCEPITFAGSIQAPARLKKVRAEVRVDIVSFPGAPFSAPMRCWAFGEPNQIVLFEHFRQHVSFFFDLCDPEYHFAVQVPSRARLYPPLMDAILALSARHMSLTRKDVDFDLANYYYQRCLSILIPEFDRVRQDRVGDLLAATIILRLHEELDGPFSASHTYRHSVGTRALLQSQAAQVMSLSGLGRAAAWAGVRQEIYASVKLHRPPAIKASPEMLHSLGSSGADSAWADKAVSHCLDVLDFCFGADCMNGDTYDVLLADNTRWEADRPASYDPLCFYQTEDPEDATKCTWDVRYHADWHAHGWAYRTLARILLVIHNPRQPRVGLNRVRAWDKVLSEVHYAIKFLCSIAQSRASIPGPSLIGCMAVWLAGDMVEDPREQSRVLDLLTSTEAAHGWPTQDLRAEITGLWAAEAQAPAT